MIEIVEKYQASVFGNFADIKPTTDIITKVIALFGDKGFIPSTFQEITQFIAPPQLRLRILSQNSEWNINFATQRIDIEKNPLDHKGTNLGPLEDFTKECSELFNRIFSEFNKKANRVSLITSGLLNEMTKDKLDNIYCLVFKPISFYDKNTPFEWGYRSVAKIDLTLPKWKEYINVITLIKRVIGQIMRNGIDIDTFNFDRIEVSFDINTVPDNQETRFDIQFINQFFSEAINIRTTILQNLGDLFND